MTKLLGVGSGVDALLVIGADAKWRTRMLYLMRKVGLELPRSTLGTGVTYAEIKCVLTR